MRALVGSLPASNLPASKKKKYRKLKESSTSDVSIGLRHPKSQQVLP